MTSISFHTAALLADSINDSSSTRKVYLLAAGLALLGVALVAITVWFWRSTRHDPELLGPLEVMGGRRFRRVDGGAQQQLLDGNRPADAQPMRWGVMRGDAAGEEIDLRASLRSTPAGYDDLRDPSLLALAHEEPGDGAVPTLSPDVPSNSTAPGDADDIDVLLAAAGISPVVATWRPATPLPENSVPENSVPENSVPENSESSTAEAAPTPDSLVPDMIGTDASAVGALVDEPVESYSFATKSKPAAVPLLIVPIDHELPENRSKPVDPEPAVDDVADAEPSADEDATDAIDQPAGIDPLLRMFKRTDG
jgi:hypothetical protein